VKKEIISQQKGKKRSLETQCWERLDQFTSVRARLFRDTADATHWRPQNLGDIHMATNTSLKKCIENLFDMELYKQQKYEQWTENVIINEDNLLSSFYLNL
jgi:hypothetical protein